MIEQPDLQQAPAPSRQAIAKATLVAFTVALVILFAIVLPAEYGIDPLKTGAALHLTDLAKTTPAKTEAKTVTGRPPHCSTRWDLHFASGRLQDGQRRPLTFARRGRGNQISHAEGRGHAVRLEGHRRCAV